MKKVLSLLVVLLSIGLAGCDAIRGLAEFHISVSNRLLNTITVYVNGGEIGEVGPNRSENFVVKLRVMDGGYTGPTASAYVIVTARDVVRDKLSTEQRKDLYEDKPENFEFNPRDFQ